MIGERIKELRIAKKWKQQDLASYLHLTQSMIAKYEKGKAVPGNDILQKLSELFDVSIDYLINGQSAPVTPNALSSLTDSDIAALAERLRDYSAQTDDAPKTPEAKILAHNIDQLPPEQRKLAVAFYDATFKVFADYFEKKGTEVDENA